MPMLNIKNEIELIVIHECNWRCPYCSEQTYDKSTLPISDVFDKISTIPINSNVTLSGGEVGLLSLGVIYKIMWELIDKGCVLNLNTNGLFISKYPHLLRYFSYILYHCSEDLYEDIKFYDYGNDYHSLVITDDNFPRFNEITRKYPNIKWNVIPSSVGDYGGISILSRDNKRLLLKKYSSHLTDDSKHRLIKDKEWSRIEFV